MIVTALKTAISDLPPNDFVLAWTAIEEIQAAVVRAEGAGALALHYVSAVVAQQLVLQIRAQRVAIEVLQASILTLESK